MNELVVNEIVAVSHSNRWGSSYSQWNDPIEPKVTVQYYTPNAGKTTLEVRTGTGTVVQRYELVADKGVNTYDYDLSVSEKEKRSLAKKDMDLKVADNGKYYLPKGEYTISIQNGDLQNSIDLKVE